MAAAVFNTGTTSGVVFMASLTQQDSGYRLQFYGPDKRKRSIWIGSASAKKAEEIKRHVEELIDARKLGVKPSPETVKWAVSVDSRIRNLLTDYGMMHAEITQSVEASRTTCMSMMDEYIEAKQHVGPKWRINFKQAKGWFFKFFPDDKLLTEVTDVECVAWLEWMTIEKKLAQATAGQHLKRCRQIFKSALLRRMIPVNPLSAVKASTSSDESRNLLVDSEDAEKIIAQTPDLEWAALIALARYGGLRCPSEVYKLRWSHILWTQNKFLVHSPKTTRYGKSKRFFPITPGLRKHLEPLYNAVAPGVDVPSDALVITRYRAGEKNLRTQLARFIERAGLPELPKPFMNMRASARFDFEQYGQFTSDELNAWFGHSEAIARKHYGRLADVSYSKAANLTYIRGDGSTGGSIGADQQGSESAKTQEKAGFANDANQPKYTRRGSNSQPSVPKTDALSS